MLPCEDFSDLLHKDAACLLACWLAGLLACWLAGLLIMEEASALSSTLHNFFISVVNFNTAFFSCQKKIPFFSVFLHKNMGLQAAVSKTAVFSVLSITGKISRNTVFPVEARQDPSMRLPA